MDYKNAGSPLSKNCSANPAAASLFIRCKRLINAQLYKTTVLKLNLFLEVQKKLVFEISRTAVELVKIYLDTIEVY
jgi:hypothetical protein